MKKFKILPLLLLLGTVSQGYSQDWVENIKFKGDLRYRHEMIDQEGKEERNRQRIRARIGMDAKVNDTVKVKIRLASGSDDPVSTNQTLDGAYSTKGIHLDRAYFEWKPEAADGLKILGGKMSNPLHKPVKSELLWDGDLNPEGLAFKFKSGEDTTFWFNGGIFWVDERSSGDDAFQYSGQVGLTFKGGDTKFTVGAGFHTFTEVAGSATFADSTDSFGNSVSTDLLGGISYLHDYEEAEAFAEMHTKLGDMPFKAYVHYVVNGDADDDDTGYAAGLKLGKAKDPGSWEFKYIFKEVEKDAVLGVFTDSDFGGGGTDVTGHELGAGYSINKNWKLGLSYFLNDVGLDAEKDYKRGMLDLKFKF